jgi:XTP/dITP diphosphohydrolase
MELLVATHNQGKVVELAALLADMGIHCVSLADVGVSADVEETGTTFEENAILKATTYARMTGMRTLADDSGLEVDALDGAPGIYTARFGGKGISQPERNALLLSRLQGVTGTARAANFRCVVALADTDGTLLATAAGRLDGEIALEPVGDGGFGYDPVFWLPEQGITLAQLSAEHKQVISHRGRALRNIATQIRSMQAADE